jgi:hypothetical protein
MAKKPNRHRCTADNPMPEDADKTELSRWSHPDMKMVYEGTLYDVFECPHCGLSQKASKPT